MPIDQNLHNLILSMVLNYPYNDTLNIITSILTMGELSENREGSKNAYRSE